MVKAVMDISQRLLNISELFYSIQGESTYAGLPCVFIRLAGCNLRCRYCDARYTYEEAHATMTMDAILSFMDGYPGTLVEITGGEPLLQESVHSLIEQLLAKGHTVLLETNGSLPINTIAPEVIVVMDIKTPDSGSAETLASGNIASAKERNRTIPGSCEIKFVLTGRNDYIWARDLVNREALNMSCPTLFSPVKGELSPEDLASWILQDQLSVRLQLQLHTLIWPHLSRGI
ncbi:MAG: radical SAM protein [Desulfocapsaceae bacterium]|nr:radical SAM protein [Desulfocapsaceae bacterium]